jgi:hypothetical protein
MVRWKMEQDVRREMSLWRILLLWTRAIVIINDMASFVAFVR